jgi:hypothetical protein
LVKFPGYPFSFEALLPDHRLAGIAESLRDGGHDTQVWDYGRVDHLEALTPEPLRERSRHIAAALLEAQHDPSATPLRPLLELRAVNRQFERLRKEQCRACAAAILGDNELDFAAFKLDFPDDYVAAMAIAEEVDRKRPALPLVFFGAFVDRHAAGLPGRSPAFLAAARPHGAPQTDEEGVLASATGVPGIYSLLAGRGGASFPEVSYDPELYPALRSGGKLLIFTVPDSRAAAGSDGEIVLREPKTVTDEIRRLSLLYGARVFWLDGVNPPSKHANAVAQSLLARGFRVEYARTCAIETPADLASFGALGRSGCQALRFDALTGSQLALDRTYGANATVTGIETALHRSAAAGVFTIARFLFPAPGDDYHSRAETMRLVDRTHPDCVQVALPDAPPGSRWGGRRRWILQQPRLRDQLNHYPKPAGMWLAPGGAVGVLRAHEAMRARDALVLEIRERGLATHVSPIAALAARTLGFRGNEAEWERQAHYALLAGDLKELRAQVGRFNELACLGSSFGYAPFRAAVGD